MNAKNVKMFFFCMLFAALSGLLVACQSSLTTLEPGNGAESLPSPTPTAMPTPTPTQTINTSKYLPVFETVWNSVNQTYFDPEFGGLDWDAVHAMYEPLILTARDDKTFYELLNQMLWELKVSHAAVGPVELWPSVEPVIWKKGEVGIDIRLLDNQAVITRLDTGSSAEATGLRTGFVIQSIAGASVEQIIADAQAHLAPPYNDQGRLNFLTNRMLSLIYGDPGTYVNLVYLDEKDEVHKGCVERIQRSRAALMEGIPLPPAYLEFESTRLEAGVGYIRFNTFHPDLLPDMLAGVAALQDAPGIIIDLRGNPGGNPDTADKLAAQFLKGETSLGSFRTRSGILSRPLTGSNVYSGPLVILIDALSFSASEYFSSGMQALGRAVVIGERSPGGLTAMNVIILPDDAILGIPVAQLITPGGQVLEGRGVTSDMNIPLERSQLLQGIDTQLQAAIDYLTGRIGQ